MNVLIGSPYRLRWLLLVGWLVWAVSVRVQAQVSFQHLTTLNGLSHGTVSAILQDHNGFLWLATGDGLNRYDGQTFTVYRHNPKDNRSLSSNEVTCLLEDRRHRLWVGTRSGGLNRLDSTGMQFERVAGGLATVAITALTQETDGTIWAAMRGQGLFRIDPATDKITLLPTRTVPERLCTDGKGHLWMGFSDGTVSQLRTADNTIRSFRLPLSNGSNTRMVMALLRDSRGTVWVGTQGRGLFRFDARRQTFVSVLYTPTVWEGANLIRSLYEDKTGRLWLGTDDGVLVYDPANPAQTVHFRAEPANQRSLSTHATACVQGDRQGNIWVGTWENGLDVWFAQSEPFARYVYQPREPNSLLTPSVAAVATDKQGNAWIGSTNGLTCLNRPTNTYRHYRHYPGNDQSIAGNDVTYLSYLSDKALLVSIWNKGTDVLNPETARVIRHLPNMQLVQLAPVVGDSTNAWVIGRQSVIGQIDLNTWQYTAVRGLPEPGYTALLETTDHTVWIGTFADGLLEWQRPTGQRPTKQVYRHPCTRRPGALHDGHVTCLFEDRRGRLWVGTSGGLYRFDKVRRQFDLITTDNGLPNDAIMSIRQDKRGNLWIATNGGLCRMNEQGKIVRTYRQEDGLPGNDFTMGAASQTADGTLFFGTKHGLAVFHPNRVEQSQPDFPVYLTGMKVFNRPVVPGSIDAPLSRAMTDTKTLTLQPDQSVFTLDFGAVLFRAHRNIRYAYRLEPFEGQWNYVGNQRSATYTNLSPGTYRFRVRASLTDEFSHAPEATVTLTVLAPWFRTGWAYALYALLVAGLLALIRRVIQVRERYRTELRLEHLEAEKARELDRVRSVFFTNISHEFRTPLTLILSPLEQLLATLPVDACRVHLRTMHHNANRLLRLINQLLDLSKLESRTLRPDISRHEVMQFVREVTDSFQPLANQRRIALTVDTTPAEYMAFFDVDILEKALYNLLANALKFTVTGGSVSVRCVVLDAATEPRFQVVVADTGVGISDKHLSHIFDRFYQVDGQEQAKKVGSGIGLALTRELVELHQGQIQATSQPGTGTVFTLTLPVAEAAFPAAWLSNRADVPDVLMETLADLPEPKDQPADTLSDEARPLLLVVEDHDELRAYLANCFRPAYRVLLAANGREALHIAGQTVPDLVVSDWLMPDMDGLELCHALKTQPITSHVPFVLLTSRSGTDSKVLGYDSGADDYVTKPFNVNLLQTRVRNLIRSRQSLRDTFARLVYLKPADIIITSGEEAFLKKLLDYINLHLADPELDSEKVEREVGMSTTQLHRKLKALAGKSASDLIRMLRLQRAVHLLEAGGMQVSEVAYAVGFSDPNYFIRVFRKEYGCPPGEYRSRLRFAPTTA